MKKILINILKSSLLGILLFGVISCDNIFSNKVSDTENTETLLKISVDNTSLARTLYPSSDASLLSNFTVTCTRDGFTTKTKSAVDLEALKALVINFADGEEGSWQIKLEASYEISSGTNVQAIAFSDTQSVDVQKNKLNEVSFKLTTQNLAVGGLNIKVSFSGSADRVVASLKDETKETSIDEKIFTTSDFTIIEEEKSITFTRSISDTSEALTSGTYYLLFSFYDTTLSSETPLNTLPNYVRIVKGLTTSAELSISLNEVYTITYEDNGGTLASGAIKTGKYSRKSIVNLPQMVKDGYIFAGWYEASDFSGDPVTTIEKGSSGNKTLYARFVSSTIYVSASGNDETNDGMSSSPLASVNKAVEKIISYGNIAAEYTIKISGTITGGVNIASTLTTEMASSLTLEGVTGKTGDTWVDVLDGGFTAGNTGTTLTLSTKVPVIIKNLKITGGYARDSGGIELYAKSFLTMDSGEISGNTGLDHAGGVYLHHGNGTWNGSSYTNVIPGAVFTMNGGTICNNTGEGITLYDGIAPGEFNMNGGTITGNSGYGVNIVNSASGSFGKFTMKGDAVVAANNKVFLGYPGSTKIYIAGELTESAPVATVTLNGYNENTEIVALAEGVTDTSLLSAACAKIEVAPYNETPWYLKSDGKITATNPNGGNGGSVPDDFSLVTGATITVPPTRFSSGGEFAYASTSDPVTVSSFYMCTHEVTQEEYEKYCFYGGSSSPSETSSKNEYPVYYINWYDAIVYCNLRSLAENLTPVYSIKKEGDTTEKSTKPAEWVGIGTSGTKYCGPDTNNSSWDWVAASPGYDSIEINSDANGYRLPTVAEWEYAARGGNGLTGTQTEYSGNSDVTQVSFDDYSIHKIMQKDPNTLQIYDMTGSVSEWLWDVAGEDYRKVSPLNDYIDYTGSASPYERNHGNDNYIGFRVVRNAVTSTAHYTVNFDVTTNWSGNTDTVSSVIVEGEGKTVSAPDYNGTRSGFVFKGWYTTAIPDETDEPFDFTIAINADMTLYAVWGPGIGCVLMTDGSFISSEFVASENVDNIVGIVYDLDASNKPRGVLGIKNSGENILAWAGNTTTGCNTKFDTIICTPSENGENAALTVTFDGDTNGSDNWTEICKADNGATENTSTNYPAFDFANKYGTVTASNLTGTNYENNWYIPSLAELCYIYRNKTVLNSVLSKISTISSSAADQLANEYYWASSQYSSYQYYAAFVRFSNGYVGAENKYTQYHVCCIRAL